MKKILSLLVAFVATATVTLAATTTTYNGSLTAKGEGDFGAYINGTQSDVKVYLTQNDDNTYTIELKNFYIDMNDPETGELTSFYIGNIKVPTLTATDTNILESKSKDGENNIILSNGDDPKDAPWLGNDLGGAKGDVKATLDGDNINLAFPVSVSLYGIDIVVDVDYTGISTTPTAISSVAVSTTSTSAVYNAAGQQVAPTAKGLVIKNGHKFINK